MKIVEYNILNGFCNDFAPFKFDKERMNMALEEIAKQQPDVLVLTEAYFWSFAKQIDMKTLPEVFEKMYVGSAEFAQTQFRWAPVVLTRYPVKKVDFSRSIKGLTYLRTEIDNGRPIALDAFHPHPETHEEQRIKFLRESIKDKREDYILAGDLNSLSPQDKYDKERLVQGYSRFTKGGQAAAVERVDRMLECSTVKEILKRGLVDTYRKINPDGFDFTVPTDLRSLHKDSGVRIDYILTTPDIRTLNAGIVKGPNAEKASDHYMTYAEVEL